jgi:hypothetical protein
VVPVKTRLGKGWDMTVRHKYVGVLLFLYRLLWGFFLFRLFDAAVTPVLARYPDLHPNADAIPMFLIEAEFRLLRPGPPDPLLWMLICLLLARMVVTPVLQAGIYYSFHHAGDTASTRFWTGIRKAWKSVVLLYWLKNALILFPALWLLPLAKDRFLQAGSVGHWMQELLPYAGVWLIWGFAVHLLFQFLSFGAASGEGISKSMKLAFSRTAGPLLTVSLALAGMGLAASAAVSAATLLWPGLAAVLIHQSYQLVRSLLSLWTAASQYAVWKES